MFPYFKFFFSGVAGGINPDFNVGDVVFVNQAFQHDFGYLGEKFKMHAVGCIPELGIQKEKNSVYFELDKFWSKNIFSAMKKNAVKFSESFENVQVNAKDYLPDLKLNGIVATGDQFIANDAKKQFLREQKADIVEMEGAAVVQIAQKNGVPCLILRSISDKAGEKAVMNFQQFFKIVAKNNASLVAYLVEQLP